MLRNAVSPNRKLKDTLSEIKSFLDSNPNDVVTIIFESYIDGDETLLMQAFTDSNTTNYLFYANQTNVGSTGSTWNVGTQGWPTLQWMSDNSKRLVVFSSAGGTFPYPGSYSSETVYGDDSLDSDTWCNTRNSTPINSKSLFVMNHFPTACCPISPEPGTATALTLAGVLCPFCPGPFGYLLPLFGGFATASAIYYADHNNDVRTHVNDCRSSRGSLLPTYPNFLAVDFFELPLDDGDNPSSVVGELQNGAPSTPSLVSPANGTPTNDTTPSFSWTAASDPESDSITYQIQVDNNSNFSSPVIDQGSLGSPSFIPSTSLSDGLYYWHARACDNVVGCASYSSSFTVKIDTVPPTLSHTINNPKYVAGVNTYVKSTTPISVAATDPTLVEGSTGSGVKSCTLSGHTQNNGSYSPNASFFLTTPDGSKTFTVNCEDNAGNIGTISRSAIVDDTPPNVTVMAPNGQEVFLHPVSTTITWSCADSGSGLPATPIKIEYSVDGGTNWVLIADNEANDGSILWNIPVSVDTAQARVRVRCVDQVTNSNSDQSNSNFTITTPLLLYKEDINPAIGNGTLYRPGNSIRYTITLFNPSYVITLQDRPGAEFTDRITDLLMLPNAGATATSGTILYDFNTRTYSWNGTIAPRGTVTLVFGVRIPTGLRGELGQTTRRTCNQGTLMADYNLNGALETTLLTSDPTPLAGAGTQTCSDITLQLDLGFPPLQVSGAAVFYTRNSAQFRVLGEGIKEIDVQIFNLAGKTVYSSGWVANGHEWGLYNSSGKPISDGVYLYTVVVRGEDGQSLRTQIKKLVIKR